MKQQWDSTGELRAAFTIRELEKAKRSCQASSAGTFVRVTLAVIFMYLIVISYLMLGAADPVFISALFLVALSAPYLYQASKRLLERRRLQKEDRFPGRESPQEG